MHRWHRPDRVTTLQVVKTGLAALLAWEAARRLLDEPQPVFAALTAMLVLQITVRQSVRQAVEKVVAVVAGVAVATALASVLGLNAWTVGLVVSGGLVVGRVLRLGQQGSVQVPVAALLVLVIGTESGLIASRIADTVLGAAVGVLVNLLVAPPVRLGGLEQTVDVLARDAADLLSTLGGRVASPYDAQEARSWLLVSRRLPDRLAAAREALDGAADSLRFNPRFRDLDVRLGRLTEALVALEHVVLQVRGVTRTVYELARAEDAPVQLAEVYAALLQQVATALSAYREVVCHDVVATDERRVRLMAAVATARGTLADAVRLGRPDVGDDRWLPLGGMLSDLDRALREIAPDGAHPAALRD